MKLKLVLTFLPFLFIAYGKSIDPSQANWHKKYVKQQNAPDPADMLLNTDPEPGLKKGFVDLFNGKDLNGWKHVGDGHMTVEDGLIQTHGGMGLLYWEGAKFGNCKLRVVFRMRDENSNSGFFIYLFRVYFNTCIFIFGVYYFVFKTDKTDN